MKDKLKTLLSMLGCSLHEDIKISRHHDYFEIAKNNKIIKMSAKHRVYFKDITDNFDYYFSAVEPREENGKSIVDYSTSIPQRVIGYPLHEIVFSSIPEPISTTKQYIEFAKLNENSIVIDLGAYSGLTSILFDLEITKNNTTPNASGKVIAIEADIFNLSCLIQNISSYKSVSGRNIEYLYSAISDKDGYEKFVADGSMGANSNFTSIFRNCTKTIVPSITLNTLATRFNLQHVDFIKCDIEGAEKYIFKDQSFFEKFSPYIIVEPHKINNQLTTKTVINNLQKFGYEYTPIEQIGTDIPLLCFTPTSDRI